MLACLISKISTWNHAVYNNFNTNKIFYVSSPSVLMSSPALTMAAKFSYFGSAATNQLCISEQICIKSTVLKIKSEPNKIYNLEWFLLLILASYSFSCIVFWLAGLCMKSSTHLKNDGKYSSTSCIISVCFRFRWYLKNKAMHIKETEILDLLPLQTKFCLK